AYAIVTFLFFKTSVKFEWIWRAIQLFFPIAATMVNRRSLATLGLTRKRLFKCIELGALVGIAIAVGFAPLYLTCLRPTMPKALSSLLIGYAIAFVAVNVVTIEIFFRGFVQPRFEIVVGKNFGLIATSLLCGFDFLEFEVFDPFTTAVAALVFGLLYRKTKSLATTISAHMVYFLLVMVLMAS
ncbi:MAG: CPBP family intramembrane glutamic endopeptidase, partial [Candidatus Hadarchaeales archaeon]